ncbi:MAG: hypothetical protein AABW81_01790, partial [Nanoarchaeota archaeon]
YGYRCQTDGVLKYNITFDSSLYKFGKYFSELTLFAGENPYTSDKQEFMITDIEEPLDGCSVRGDGGNLIINEINLGEGDINFHIPLGNAANGKGSFSAQKGSERLEYKYEIKKVIQNTNSMATILVMGEYKLQRDKQIQEDAIITLDKINKKVSLKSKTFSIEDMKVTFMNRC